MRSRSTDLAMQKPRHSEKAWQNERGNCDVTGNKLSLFPFPEGWYFVAERPTILKKQLIQKQWLGQDIVVWCDSKGAICVAQSVCPHLQRHLCPAAPETARYRLLPQRLAARPQAARQHGRPRAQPVVGPGGNRRGQPSIPDQRRSSYRRARTQPRRQDAHRHRTRGRKHPRPPAAGRNLLLRRRRPRTLRRNRRRSRRHRENRRLVRLRCGPPPIATMSMSFTSSCRGSTKSSPTYDVAGNCLSLRLPRHKCATYAARIHAVAE